MADHQYPTVRNHRGLTWIKIKKPRKKEILFLQKKFGFSMMHLNDCLPPLQSPRLIGHENYLFMILTFPVYQPKTHKIIPVEIDFFIGKNYIVTSQEIDFFPLDNLFNEYKKIKKLPDEMGTGPGVLLYEILDKSMENARPMVTHINNDIEELEDQIFQKIPRQKVIREILMVRRNIVSFRKSIQSHKTIIRKMLDKADNSSIFPTKRLRSYFANLVADLKEIWDILENYSETVKALFESNESLYSDRLNSIIKTLTIFSVIVFPLTLIAAIFGMNTEMPIVDSPYAFYKILGLMGAGTLVMLAIFKKKRWI
ncbi:MAG: magnesium transporter CorA family protein [Patescibacteria group bacterium]